MKPIFAALVIMALAFPATSQGNSAPMGQYGGSAAPSAPAYTPAVTSDLAQQALNACPGLMSRTDSAVANGHVQYYYSYDCECMAQSIDYNTWNESTAAYDGPLMSEDDASIIIDAVAYSDTIESAFSEIESSISETGYSAISLCFGK